MVCATAFVFFLAAACGSDAEESRTGDTETVRGLVRGLESTSPLELTSLTVVDESGLTWTFEARGRRFPALTPSHLREHMVLGQAVTVTFSRDEEGLVLEGLED